MKELIDEFEYKTIEIHGETGIERHPAFCYGEIFATKAELDNKSGWILGCIPRGCMFPIKRIGWYENIENALGAAKAMSEARNSWATLDGFGAPEKEIMMGICERFNGYVKVSNNIPVKGPVPFLNNASRADYH